MQRRFSYLVSLLILLFAVFAASATASDGNLEKDMQWALLQSKIVIKTMQARLNAQFSISYDLTRLQAIAEEIRATHLLLDARFAQREERMQSLGTSAIERHAEVLYKYRQNIEAYLNQLETFKTEQDVSPNILDNLLNTLNNILSEKKRPIYGSLPYRHLNFASRKPLLEPAITPAYKGGNPDLTGADLAAAPEAPITKEIAELAESLDWNPVLIYEWVKNNIETQWYYGCMKGAAETLRQKSGNDADQAALLVALLRSADFPVRYVRGVVKFYPDIERGQALIGAADENELAEFFRKAGIPFTPVIGGGKIANIQFEHIWVETLVPYANYRGAVIDEHGKTWLALDTSIKVAGYTANEPQSLPDDFDLAVIRDEYLSDVREETPLEYLSDRLAAHLEDAQADFGYDDLLYQRTLVPEEMNILPAGLQFTETAVTAEYAALPEELLHQARFKATDKNYINLFDITLPLYTLSNQMITITYEPETVEDQEIINSYGGLDNTPAYLVRLRPALKVNGERQAVGQDGLPMGEDFRLAIELMSPVGSQRIENTHVIGNLSVIGLVAQDAVLPDAVDDKEKDAQWLLHDAAIAYIDRWNRAEAELASLLRQTIARPVATLVTVGGVIDVTYLLDSPHGFDWKGLFVDADLRTVETVNGPEHVADPEPVEGPEGDGLDSEVIFMQLSALQGSFLENQVLEDRFQVEGISTAKLLGIAARQGTTILTIDADNIETLLSALLFAENIKEDIVNAVNQNYEIRIPEFEIAYEDWLGIGYIKENPQTGEAGYMLSGVIAGGMTVWNALRWSEEMLDRILHPFSEPPNYDPAAAVFIHKIPASDMQRGTAGEVLSPKLEVLVRDAERRPVKGAAVTFTVKAGGGRLQGENDQTGISITVLTNRDGIALAELILGAKTAANPTMIYEPLADHGQQVGENIVDAALASGTALDAPFIAYGLPGPPAELRMLHGDGKFGEILSWAGLISVMLEDKNDNPISNHWVNFSVEDVTELLSCPNGNSDNRQALLMPSEDTCVRTKPTYQGCQANGAQSQDVVTSAKGASVQMIYGALPGAKYTIKAASGGLARQFSLYTIAFGNCDGDTVPSHRLYLSIGYESDEHGININAAKPGDYIDLRAGMYLLREHDKITTVTLSCDTNNDGQLDFNKNCDKITGARQYTMDPGFKAATVRFGDQAVSAHTDGIFQARYQLEAGVNTVPVNGIGTIGIQKAIISCTSDCAIVDEDIERNAYGEITVYGVQIEAEPNVIVPVDENIALTDNFSISYTIKPQQYTATTITVVLLKNGEPIGYLAGETVDNSPGDGRVGEVTLTRGSRFDLESIYQAQVVLNIGTGVEIRSEKMALNFAPIYIEKEDPEFADVKLRWDDYYPPLGDKTIVVKADGIEEGSFGGRKITAEVTYPDTGATITPVEPDDGAGKFFDGKVEFQLSARGLAPSVNDDPTTGVDKISIKFSLFSVDGKPEGVIYGSWNVKNNSNTTLGEVLNGEAVFLYDGNDAEYNKDNHKGVTEANVEDDNLRKFDFVQELLNQVVPRKRSVTGYKLLDEDGIYHDKTENAIKTFKQEFNIENTNINELNDFNKLMKDYGKREQADDEFDTKKFWFNRIIDKYILVVEKWAKTDNYINDGEMGNDTGLYELYDNVVKPFIVALIEEAERYAGLGNDIVPKDAWIARSGQGPADSAKPHGSGMSYCYGGKQDIDSFNETVSKFKTPPNEQYDAIPEGYRGDIDDNTGLIGASNDKKKWPGLISDEWDAWFEAGQIPDHNYNPTYWAGIDCSGLVQRTVEAAKELNSIKEKINVTIPPVPEDMNVNLLFDTNGRLYSFEKKLFRKLHKGDVVRYDGHVSIVHSNKPTVKGKYNIIHAYGIPKADLDNSIATPMEFSRKVLISPNDMKTSKGIFPRPTGFGKIMLWE
jgi:transglutaminase-like putative cysteine protease